MTKRENDSNTTNLENGFPKRTIVFAAIVVSLHWACAHLLDMAGLVENLLSPNGAQLLWVLPLAVLFYALRLMTFFIVPGIVIGHGFLWGMQKVRKRFG